MLDIVSGKSLRDALLEGDTRDVRHGPAEIPLGVGSICTVITPTEGVELLDSTVASLTAELRH